jgi:type 1 fimbria pilin
MKSAMTVSLFLAACAMCTRADANGGTIHFVGALVEPTCSTTVLPQQPQPRQLAANLHSCLVPRGQGASSAAAAEGQGAQVVGALHTVALPASVAAVAGRNSIEALTVDYD